MPSLWVYWVLALSCVKRSYFSTQPSGSPTSHAKNLMKLLHATWCFWRITRTLVVRKKNYLPCQDGWRYTWRQVGTLYYASKVSYFKSSKCMKLWTSLVDQNPSASIMPKPKPRCIHTDSAHGLHAPKIQDSSEFPWRLRLVFRVMVPYSSWCTILFQAHLWCPGYHSILASFGLSQGYISLDVMRIDIMVTRAVQELAVLYHNSI